MMNQDEVLKLFESEAAKLEKPYFRSQDTIGLLAEVIARCGDRLSKEDLAALIHIGGTLVKLSDIQTSARDDVAATMQSSHDSISRDTR